MLCPSLAKTILHSCKLLRNECSEQRPWTLGPLGGAESPSLLAAEHLGSATSRASRSSRCQRRMYKKGWFQGGAGDLSSGPYPTARWPWTLISSSELTPINGMSLLDAGETKGDQLWFLPRGCYNLSFLLLGVPEEQMGPCMHYQASFQHHARKCLTTVLGGGVIFAAFANFHGVNTPNHGGFQATSVTHSVWSGETHRHTLSYSTSTVQRQ